MGGRSTVEEDRGGRGRGRGRLFLSVAKKKKKELGCRKIGKKSDRKAKEREGDPPCGANGQARWAATDRYGGQNAACTSTVAALGPCASEGRVYSTPSVERRCERCGSCLRTRNASPRPWLCLSIRPGFFWGFFFCPTSLHSFLLPLSALLSFLSLLPFPFPSSASSSPLLFLLRQLARDADSDKRDSRCQDRQGTSSPIVPADGRTGSETCICTSSPGGCGNRPQTRPGCQHLLPNVPVRNVLHFQCA